MAREKKIEENKIDKGKVEKGSNIMKNLLSELDGDENMSNINNTNKKPTRSLLENQDKYLSGNKHLSNNKNNFDTPFKTNTEFAKEFESKLNTNTNHKNNNINSSAKNINDDVEMMEITVDISNVSEDNTTNKTNNNKILAGRGIKKQEETATKSKRTRDEMNLTDSKSIAFQV
jgi:hypothetical protein